MPDREQTGVPDDEVEADGQDGPDTEHGSECHSESDALPERENDSPSDDEYVRVEFEVALFAESRHSTLHKRRSCGCRATVHR